MHKSHRHTAEPAAPLLPARKAPQSPRGSRVPSWTCGRRPPARAGDGGRTRNISRQTPADSFGSPAPPAASSAVASASAPAPPRVPQPLPGSPWPPRVPLAFLRPLPDTPGRGGVRPARGVGPAAARNTPPVRKDASLSGRTPPAGRGAARGPARCLRTPRGDLTRRGHRRTRPDARSRPGSRPAASPGPGGLLPVRGGRGRPPPSGRVPAHRRDRRTGGLTAFGVTRLCGSCDLIRPRLPRGRTRAAGLGGSMEAEARPGALRTSTGRAAVVQRACVRGGRRAGPRWPAGARCGREHDRPAGRHR